MVIEDKGRYEKAQGEEAAWTLFWQSHLSTYCEFYEIPMMDGQYGLLSFWIDAAMRSGLESSNHHQVACFYGNKTYYQHLLDITDLSKAQVFLLDKNGHILYRATGAPTRDDKQKVLHLLQTNV